MMSMIQLEQVSMSFGTGLQEVAALKDVSLNVKAGELVAVIGPSGSGKSTFLSIAGALQKQSAGSVKINGKDLGALKPRQLARFRLEEIGFVLQTSNLVPYLNVLDQLLVVKKMSQKVTQVHKQEALALLSQLGLGDLAAKMPHELSGGQRQRVAVARAFINDPSMILADEPTASLDTEKAVQVVELLAKEVHQRNKAAIMVTHDERLLPYCDKVFRMEDGRLMEQVN